MNESQRCLQISPWLCPGLLKFGQPEVPETFNIQRQQKYLSFSCKRGQRRLCVYRHFHEIILPLCIGVLITNMCPYLQTLFPYDRILMTSLKPKGFIFEGSIFEGKIKNKKMVMRQVCVNHKNPAYGRQSISRPMRIVAPMPQEGGPRIPNNPIFLKNGKITKNQETSRNMTKLALRPSTRGL